MSPGSVTEKLHFFIAEYDDASSKTERGGDAHDGEEIEVLEFGLDEALQMIERGEIQDGKTIMLLQHAKLSANSAEDRSLFADTDTGTDTS
jgi:hypothetical protein